MIASLATQLGKFPGRAHRARCLAHVVNLVVSIILRQFDVRKKSAPDGEDELAQESDMEREEKEMDRGTYNDDIAKGVEDIEAIERELELEEDIASSARHAKPVQRVLVKVRYCHTLCPYL
jgi:hypothetical protein